MSQIKLDAGYVKKDSISSLLQSALDAGEGLLRLTPTWVPRSFLHPGRRIKLNPADLYAFGANRGGIDERWFSSTTEAANEGRVWHEGLSFCLFEGKKFLLRDAVSEAGQRLVGDKIYSKYNRWPVYSKFFDNMGPIPHHMHQSQKDAALVGQEGKPESYYFPPQYNNVDNNFCYTFMGPRTWHDQGRLAPLSRELEQRRQWYSRPLEGLSTQARHGLVDSTRCIARARFTVHL